jgi:hypothetical protein
VSGCRQKAFSKGAIVPCSLDAGHVTAGEHHFALDGLVEWAAYGTDAKRVTAKRSALAASLLGPQETP